PARLSRRDGRGDLRQRVGRPGQPSRRRAVRRGGPPHPGPGRVSTRATLALLGALALALFVVGAGRGRTAASAAGRRFFNHPPAAWGLFTLAFFVTVALAAPWVAP